MNYKQFVKDLVNQVGGEENINDAYFCMTRLRINVKDKTKVNTDAIKTSTIVKQVQYKGNELQVVIGTEVNQVYDALMLEVDASKFQKNETVGEDRQAKNVFNRVVDFLGGIFVPIIPALVAGGMLKSIITLLQTASLLDGSSDLAILLNIAADSVFYFLPFFIAITTARVMNTNPFLSLMVAGSLMYPTLINGLESGAEALVIAGIKIPIIGYSGSVFPIILGVILLKYVYGFLDKRIHKNIRMVFAPLLAILITVPITLAFLAPMGHYLGNYLAMGVTWIFDTNGVIAATLIGAFLPLIVMAGMHQSLFPIMLGNLATYGVDSLLPIFYLQTLAMAGATFAVFFTAKKSDVKATALSTGISAIFGITEPALYGVAIPLKKPLMAVLIASGVSGGLSNLLGVRAFAFGLPSFLSIPTYVNAAKGSSLFSVLLSSGVALVLAFILSYVFVKGSKEAPEKHVDTPQTNSIETVYAPVSAGQIVDLKTLKDDVFAQEIMGPTLAIKTKDNQLYAPITGEVLMISETKHAIGLKTSNNLEVLIHIGIDTVKLNGEPFSSTLQVGDHVQQGDLLTTVDLEYLKEQGIDDTIVLAITNQTAVRKMANNDDVITKQSKLFEVSI